MLRSRIVPCLLMTKGGLVKTRKFAEPRYVGDPINAVRIFNEKEVDELVLLDIHATSQGVAPDMRLLAHIAAESRMPLCYGGGINSVGQVKEIIASGYEKVSLSSAALENPALVADAASAVGTQSVVVTVDVKRKTFGSGYVVMTHNGTRKHAMGFVEALKAFERHGAGEVVVNSIDRDGMCEGYDLDLARLVRDTVSCPISLVGGSGGSEDMQKLIDTVGVCGAVAGSQFVFRGKYRAVLISYSKPARLR